MSKFHISSHDSLRLMNDKYFKFMIITVIPIRVATTLLTNKIIIDTIRHRRYTIDNCFTYLGQDNYIYLECPVCKIVRGHRQAVNND